MAIGFEKKKVKKEQQRAEFMEKRKNMSKIEAAQKSALIQKRLSTLMEYSEADTIMFYLSVDNEVMTDKAISQALKLGKRVVLPVVDAENKTLIPIATDMKNLKKGAYSIPEPEGEPVNLDEIDIVVVPVVAFDDEGDRLGRGIGYYDRFLKSLHAVKVGLAYDWQQAPNIPQESHDAQMDKIVTERNVVECRR